MTTAVRVEKLVKDFLDELTDDDFTKFLWYVHFCEKDGARPIPKSRLKDITREDTVDKLVEFYGEDDAVVTTVDTFFKMNLNDLALKLTKASIDRKEQQSYETVSSTERKNQRDSTGTQDLSCSLCSDVFTEPVVLQCGHSFCRSCIRGYWRGKISWKCPLCQQVMPHTEPQINYVVNRLSQNCRQRSQVEPSGGHRHELYQTPSKNIKEKQEAFEKVKLFCDSSIEQIKSQSCDTEKKIRDKFEELHLFLKKEEETRLAALREEETQKIRTMQSITKMSRNTFSLSDTVKEMEKLGADDSFIQTFKMERTQKALPDPQLLPQSLINVSKHVENLQFRVWQKMLSIIKSNPNIASRWQPKYEEWASNLGSSYFGEDDAFFDTVTRFRFKREQIKFEQFLRDSGFV